MATTYKYVFRNRLGRELAEISSDSPIQIIPGAKVHLVLGSGNDARQIKAPVMGNTSFEEALPKTIIVERGYRQVDVVVDVFLNTDEGA